MGEGSRMAASYSHSRDAMVAVNVFLSTHASKDIRLPEPQFRPLLCPKCSGKNTLGMKYCGRCGCPLERSELAASSVEIEEPKSQVSEIKSLLEKALSRPQR
jgi:hypothetical protein